MKLIIDIDERAYKGCVKLKNNDDMGILGFHLINATANGTPLEEELEKIKAEIGKEFVDLQDGSEEWRSYVNESVLSCYEIVENRIHELKGGANDRF